MSHSGWAGVWHLRCALMSLGHRSSPGIGGAAWEQLPSTELAQVLVSADVLETIHYMRQRNGVRSSVCFGEV